MPTKDETAKFLAAMSFRLDQGTTRIFRIREPDELNPTQPVKLLEVNEITPEVGISPIGLGADPDRGVPFRTVIVEISPDELTRLQKGELTLPHGWSLGEELFPSVTPAEAAS